MISPILLFATNTITRSITKTVVDKSAVTIAKNKAEMDTACEPRKRELMKVINDNPADIGCKTSTTNRPWRTTWIITGLRPVREIRFEGTV